MLLCRLYPNNYFIHANIQAINENNYQYTLICSISTSHRIGYKFVCFHLPQNIFNWNLRAPAHLLMKSNTAANLTAHVYVSKKSLATTAKTIWICWGKFMSYWSSFDNKKQCIFVKFSNLSAIVESEWSCLSGVQMLTYLIHIITVTRLCVLRVPPIPQ